MPIAARGTGRARFWIAIGLVAAAYLLLALYAMRRFGSDPLAYGDFFPLWSYGRVTLDQGARLLYDPAPLHAAQVALGLPPATAAPYPYPPTFLLLLAPLGRLPCSLAFLIWTFAGLAVYAWATFGRDRPGGIAVFALLAAPATQIAFGAGQSGLFAAALLVGGAQMSASRPLSAGLLLGLLSYKPQLGLLVPVALVAGRRWRCLLAAAVTAAGLAGVTSALFGWTIWADWVASLPAYAGSFADQAALLASQPTVTANLRLLGAPWGFVHLVQAGAFAGAAVAVWRCWRGGATTRAVAVLAGATFIASPHAFIYDMPMVTAAVARHLLARQRVTGGLAAGDYAVALLTFALPALAMLLGRYGPVGAVGSLCVVGLLLREPWRDAAPEAAA